MQAQFQTGTITILGKRGSGKTTLSNAIAQLRPNVLCIDPLGDNDFGDPVTWGDLPLIRHGGQSRLSLFTAPKNLDREEASRRVFRFILLAAEAGKLPNPFTLYIDEADMYGNAYWNDESLRRLANYGRHWGVSFIVNARRYAAIPKDWTSQSDMIIMGPSVDVIADGRIVMGLIGRARLSQWENLEPYQFIAKGLDGIGYTRYNGYSGEHGYIEYTPMPRV